MLAAAQKQGPRALAGAKALQAVMHSAIDLDDIGKLDALNQFFNRRIQSREDIDVWGQVDYWASPMEMMEKGAGDCEDFAIAKYFSLVALGMAQMLCRGGRVTTVSQNCSMACTMRVNCWKSTGLVT